MCGSTAAQNQINQSQINLYNTMSSVYGQEFSQSESIFNELQTSLAPIVAAGPNQQGFSPAELAAMNSQAIGQAGNSYSSQIQAEKEGAAAAGGGNSLVPSGAQDQIRAQIGSNAENQESNALNTITQNNFATGRSNYFNAVGALSGATGVFGSANSAGGAAAAGGSSAMSGANSIQQADGSWMGLVGGILGNVSGTFDGGKITV